MGRGQPTKPDLTTTQPEAGALNWNAMADVYKKAGIDLSGQFNLFGMGTGYDFNPAIKVASIDTNLDALEALSPDTKEFLSVIEKYPDLKKSTGDLFKDEGFDVITNLQKLMTGDGNISMGELDEALQNDARRGMFVKAIDLAATDKETSAFVVEFTQKALKAGTKEATNKDKQDFLNFAKDHGIDTGAVEKDAMLNIFKDLWENPEKAVVDLVRSMNLPPELSNMIAGFMAPLVSGMKDIANHYAFGEFGQGGFVGAFKEAGVQSADAGKKLMEKYPEEKPIPVTPAATPAPGGP